MTGDRRTIFQQALRYATAGRIDEADALVRRSSPKPARDAEGLCVRGQIATLGNRPSDAKSLLEKSIRVKPTANALLHLAHHHISIGEGQYVLDRYDDDPALTACRAALELAPEDPSIRIRATAILLELARVDDAEHAIAPVLAGHSLDSPAGRRAATLQSAIEVRRGILTSAIDRLQSVLATDPPALERRGALSILAKALDRAGRHDEAFIAASQRDALDPPAPSPASVLARADRIIESNSRKSLERVPFGPNDDRPVFIAGMPRSGTSLLDRIIDAHPLAAGVGERPILEQASTELEPHLRGGVSESVARRIAVRCVREMADAASPQAIRVVNKSLENVRLLGLAWRLMPAARVVHVIRDPRDVAVSCHFGQFNAGKYPWTTSIASIAAAWEASHRIMTHWRETIDLPILEVRYERLVRDPEHEFPRVVEFLGLEWDETCRGFHETGRSIRTLSLDQVSRPLYTTSVGRYESYSRHLADVDWPTYDPDA